MSGCISLGLAEADAPVFLDRGFSSFPSGLPAPTIVLGRAYEQDCHEIRRLEGQAFAFTSEVAIRAAIAVAFGIVRTDPSGLLLLLPPEDSFTNRNRFAESLETAVAAATAGWIAFFGLQLSPDDANYGALEAGAPLVSTPGTFRVKRFIAQTHEGSDSLVFRNSGAFVLRADVLLAEIGCYAPEFLPPVTEVLSASGRAVLTSIDARIFTIVPDISVASRVVKRISRAAIVPYLPS